SRSGNKPGVFTAPHRLGNSETVWHGAWHDYDECEVGWLGQQCSRVLLCPLSLLTGNFPKSRRSGILDTSICEMARNVCSKFPSHQNREINSGQQGNWLQ
ncbi:MAG: hypothetical protein WAJ88_01610, partial [Pseudolabrys sp.]